MRHNRPLLAAAARTATALAVAVLAVAIGGCSAGTADEEQTYCSSLDDAKDDFLAMAEGDFAELDRTVRQIEALGESAPDAVHDEWEVLVGAVTDLRAALDEVGLAFSDLDALQGGELPEGVDRADLMKVATQMRDLNPAEMQAATQGIQVHAKEACDVDLTR